MTDIEKELIGILTQVSHYDITIEKAIEFINKHYLPKSEAILKSEVSKAIEEIPAWSSFKKYLLKKFKLEEK